MTTFSPTHTLTINDSTTAVAVVDDDWQPCEPEPGAQLVTREEWEAEGSVSYTLDADGRLCCNSSPYGYGNSSWSLSTISPAGIAGEADGVEDRRHDDGEILDWDGVPVPAPTRPRIAWSSPSGEREYLAAYRAARAARG